MLKADFHTHTTYCDGKNTPAEMVKAAYDMGFTDFGISGHGDYSPAEPGFGMTDSILSSYMKELYELREQYRGKMNLYIGIETDCLGRSRKQNTPSAPHTIWRKMEHLSLLTPVRKYKKMQSISSGMMTGMHLPETIMKRRP